MIVDGPRADGRIKLVKASSQLAAKIRADILAGGLEVGAELASESELVVREALSRSSVREALRILEHEGLITIRRGKEGGVFVASPDPSSIGRSLAYLLSVDSARTRDLIDFREEMEPLAARLAARRADTEAIEALVRMAEDDTVHGSDFHVALARATGQLVFAVMMEAFFGMLTHFDLESELSRADHELACAAHVRIAHLVAAGDEDAADRAMRAHIRAYSERLAGHGGLDGSAIPLSRWRRI